jgi:hypothetical protein
MTYKPEDEEMEVRTRRARSPTRSATSERSSGWS